MKRIILAVALVLAGAFAARADVDGWTPVGKHARSGGDADMVAASDACELQVGRNLNGVPTSPQSSDAWRGTAGGMHTRDASPPGSIRTRG
jgi:hypothetical protein